jgi:hypothetical protein
MDSMGLHSDKMRGRTDLMGPWIHLGLRLTWWLCREAIVRYL